MTIFGELDHRLSVVKRWSVIQTIREQSVAEHSFNVALIALRITEKWFAITGSKLQTAVLKHALFHDWWESVTGDPPTYMKRFIDEAGAIAAFKADGTSEGIDLSDVDRDFVKFVVKAADIIEAIIFLRMEVSLGNRSVTRHIDNLEDKLINFFDSNPVRTVKTATLMGLYRDDIVNGMFNRDGQFISELHGFTK